MLAITIVLLTNSNPFLWLLQLLIWLLLQELFLASSLPSQNSTYLPLVLFKTFIYIVLFLFCSGCMALFSACFLSLQNHKTGRDLRDHPIQTFSLVLRKVRPWQVKVMLLCLEFTHYTSSAELPDRLKRL